MLWRRTTLGIVGALCVSALVIGPAGAQAPSTAKLRIVGGTTIEPGKFIKDDQRFAPRNRAVRSGGKVRLRDKSQNQEPHTLSLVRKRQLPDTAQEAFECEVCGSFFEAHEANEETGEVGRPLVDVGDPGFDRPGDSIFVPPGGTVRFDIGADAGKRLYYLCAIHPWMQGKFRVR
jgi:hypothetical protein